VIHPKMKKLGNQQLAIILKRRNEVVRIRGVDSKSIIARITDIPL